MIFISGKNFLKIAQFVRRRREVGGGRRA